ncbi:MAG: alpha-galactosidase, partial [Clostridia bacterium]|nr:alpha-galactosidase [Clostridia bacterium]
MKKELSRFVRGDLLLRYETDERGRVGLLLVPRAAEPLLKDKDAAPESLIQVYIRGDTLPSAYSSGRTMCGSGSTEGLRFLEQTTEGDLILTRFSDPTGKRLFTHRLLFSPELRALEISTEAENAGDEPFTLEMLSSGTLGGLTPFDGGEAPDSMEITEAVSSWSSEGRFVTQSVEDAGLETSWARHGVRVKKFGVAGSLPVNGRFPFVAVRDRLRNVTWAASLEAAASWQIELRRKDYGLSLSGGLADFDFGHWAKTLSPGERFRTPSLFLTAAAGDAEKAAARLLDIAERNRPKTLSLPPVMFNEYCTTWGVPSHENLKAIVEKLRGRGMEYLVIDAGWYKNEKYDWSQSGGDWIPAEKLLFPEGFGRTAAMIREAGMVPGLWFESETCGPKSAL